MDTYRMPRAGGTKPLATERLNLRPFKKRDAAALAECTKDSGTLKYLMMPVLKESDAAINISSWRSQYKQPDFFHWCLARADDDECIGFIDASLDESQSAADISYVISPAARGMGYAAEALKEIIAYLHGECDIHRITAEINTENTSSTRVAEKCGMELEGIHRDALTDRNGLYYDVAVFAHLAGD